MLDDGAFDAKPVLNTIVSKGYIPIVKEGLNKPKGIWGKDKRQSIQ
jgi:hypothetical protein